MRIERDSDGKPIVELTEFKGDIYVCTRNETQFLSMLRLLEVSGFRWSSGHAPTELFKSYKNQHGGNIDLYTWGEFTFGYDLCRGGSSHVEYQKYLEKEGISEELLAEVNAWFDARS